MRKKKKKKKKKKDTDIAKKFKQPALSSPAKQSNNYQQPTQQSNQQQQPTKQCPTSHSPISRCKWKSGKKRGSKAQERSQKTGVGQTRRRGSNAEMVPQLQGDRHEADLKVGLIVWMTQYYMTFNKTKQMKDLSCYIIYKIK
jgi:hypothetical protein